MSKKQIISTILILAVAFLVGWGIYLWWTPFSGSRPGQVNNKPGFGNVSSRPGMGGGAGFNRMVNALDMSDEQIDALTGIERQYRQQMALYIEQLDSVDLNILEEIKKVHPDRERLDSLAVTSGQIQYALKKATSDHFWEVKNLCTPEQRERFNEVISDINQYRRGRGQGNGRGHRQGGQRRGWKNR
jgi:Spy/CpxP family protein refolding chaperone